MKSKFSNLKVKLITDIKSILIDLQFSLKLRQHQKVWNFYVFHIYLYINNIFCVKWSCELKIKEMK